MNEQLVKQNSAKQTMPLPNNSRKYTPAVDIVESSDDIRLQIDLPGVNREDIDLSVENGILRITAPTVYQEPEGYKSIVHESRFGTFERVFRLADTVKVDEITATSKNGVLTLSIPKREEVKTRRIEIK